MKRRAFNPTAEQRGWVEALSSHGVPEAEICLLIKYPETGAPIGLETLRKHFAEEIATGASKMKLLVGRKRVSAPPRRRASLPAPLRHLCGGDRQLSADSGFAEMDGDG